MAIQSTRGFIKWFNTFNEEKGINLDEIIEIEGNSGVNIMPIRAVTEQIKNCCLSEQLNIHKMLVKFDFYNENIADYYKHLAQAIAI